jgi:hypothetical protein
MAVALAVERFGGGVKVCPPGTFPETFSVLRGMSVADFLYILKIRLASVSESKRA